MFDSAQTAPPLAGRVGASTFKEFAMISGSALLSLVISLVIAGLVFWLVLWFCDYVGVPEPFNKVIKVIVGLAALIFLINVLMSMAGSPLIRLS